ncbi:MAG: acyltransferase [Deltaproteobacteria bacterium]|nr:acyltransferase [Deltaproteobacteria bacterium]MCB9478951.1 acyltransferase [Deltaproteobacteria bacterium]MCB9487844.1 acyltransferase [Deltaproteobacteria bacterium]
MPLAPLPEPKNPFKRYLHLFFGIVTGTVLFSVLLAVNGIQMVLAILRPIAPGLNRRLNRFFANSWWGWCDWWAQSLYGVQFIYSGDDPPIRENALVMANHQEMADVPVIFAFAQTKKRLGDIKWFVKDVIKWFPGPGWGMYFLDCLYVKRDWNKDKTRIQKTFANLIDNNIPYYLMTFAEGTRIRPQKLSASQKYAVEIGIPVTEHVMVPRTKGVVASIQGLRGHMDAVYDLTIGYVDGVPTLWQWFKGLPKRVHLHVRRFPASELPQSAEDLTRWVFERYQEKDRLLAYYYEHGAFPETRDLPAERMTA